MAIDHRMLASLFAMNDSVWARHANPWSVWTRVAASPALVAAIWSRAWLGWWSLVPIGLMLAFLWLNPRLFAKPRRADSWSSRAVFGERIWLERGRVPVPSHHRLVPIVLSLGALLGLAPLVWGLIDYSLWATLLGLAVVMLSKLWFVDRMVWLFQDMKDRDPRYRSWLD